MMAVFFQPCSLKAHLGPCTQETGLKTNFFPAEHVLHPGLCLEIHPSLHPTFQSLTPVCRINIKDE